MSGPTAGPVDLGRARLAIAAAFGTQGLVFISLTTRLPRIQDRWDLGELALSGVLLMMVLLAGAGSLLAERLAPRLDSAVVLRVGLLVVAASVAVVVLAPAKGVFVVALAAYGVGLGLVDATGNMQAVALEHRLGRVVLPSCHGAWTLGGVIGAVLTLASTDVPWSAIAVLALLPLAATVAPYLPRDHGEAATSTDTDVPWRAIVMVGLALVVFYTVDTAAATWGPVYLDDVFAAPEELVALATLPYLLASGLVRLAGDRLTEQVGAVRLLRVGAAVALVALVVVVASPTWQVAVLGFTLLGCGVAVVAPLSFSAAAALAGRNADPATRQARVDAVVARFNQFNYAGALLGAVMTGAVGAGSLRVGFAVPLVLVIALFWLAKAFAPADDHAPADA
ncbi:MFS transporter [Nocardioides sp. Root122]|uniref:MFS transporter n=1 Tax=Nocardioides TaxID=1839 RepID=UPI000702FFC3|nr:MULTISPECIES: MFS transporter [Nocardioides]KQV64861.1 MFS transporter [Nocardioides sp. Root122]MCK9823732.1 MFS transporter [Nocardioides cavernae]